MLIEFNIEVMSCERCRIAVEKELARLELDSVNVNIGRVQVKFNQNKISREKIVDAIELAGYKVITSSLN